MSQRPGMPPKPRTHKDCQSKDLQAIRTTTIGVEQSEKQRVNSLETDRQRESRAELAAQVYGTNSRENTNALYSQPLSPSS